MLSRGHRCKAQKDKTTQTRGLCALNWRAEKTENKGDGDHTPIQYLQKQSPEVKSLTKINSKN